MMVLHNRTTIKWIVVVMVVTANLIFAAIALAQSPDTTFSYQGSLSDGSGPKTDTCSFEFSLYDASTDGTQLGSTQTRTGVEVNKGLFAVELDFGAAAFPGEPRYLEIAVQCSADDGLTTLTPRQSLYPTPYSMYAAYAAQAGTVTWGDVTGQPLDLAVISDTISSLNCADDELPQWDTAAQQWGCTAAGDSLSAGPGITIISNTISNALTAGTGLTLNAAQLALTAPYRLPQSCAGGELPQWDTAAQQWTCTAPGDALSAGTGITIISNTVSSALTAGTGLTLNAAQLALTGSYRLPQSCADLEIPKWNGSDWVCAIDSNTDTDTTYSAGTGLSLAGTTFGVASAYQLPQSCSDSQIPKWNGTAWACAADVDTNTDTNTTYSAGTGLSLAGTTFGVASAYQLPQSCSDSQIPKWNGTAWACAADVDTNTDTNTTYTAGTGISLVGTTFGVASAYQLPQGCAGSQIPRWNGSAWACAADVDTNTTYSAGTGLSLAGTTFNTALTAGDGISIVGATVSNTQPDPANVIWVAKSGGDFSTIQAALNSISDASTTNPYLVLVAPGVYNEQVTMKANVDIQGAGIGKTIIHYTGGSSQNSSSATVIGANNAELRFVTVESSASSSFAIGFFSDGVSARLTHVAATATGGSLLSIAVSADGPAVLAHVTGYVPNGNGQGVYLSSGVTTQDVSGEVANGSGEGIHIAADQGSVDGVTGRVSCTSAPLSNGCGIYIAGGTTTLSNSSGHSSCGSSTDYRLPSKGVFGVGTVTLINVTGIADGAGERNAGVDLDNGPIHLTNVTASASGGRDAYGVLAGDWDGYLNNVTSSASGGSNSNYAVVVLAGTPRVKIINSVMNAAVGSNATCGNVYNSSYTLLNSTCQ